MSLHDHTVGREPSRIHWVDPLDFSVGKALPVVENTIIFIGFLTETIQLQKVAFSECVSVAGPMRNHESSLLDMTHGISYTNTMKTYVVGQ